jgi:hypothetical protein
LPSAGTEGQQQVYVVDDAAAVKMSPPATVTLINEVKRRRWRHRSLRSIRIFLKIIFVFFLELLFQVTDFHVFLMSFLKQNCMGLGIFNQSFVKFKNFLHFVNLLTLGQWSNSIRRAWATCGAHSGSTWTLP